MPFAGRTIMARQFVTLIAGHWPNSKVKAVATALGESLLSIGAWHDNLARLADVDAGLVVANVETYEPAVVLDPQAGKVRLSDGEIVTAPESTLWIVSRDCGVFEINIPAQYVGTVTEWDLRTESTEEATFMRVARQNVEAAYRKWTEPWTRNGKRDFRRWQPWVAYTTGWATFPEAWVWKQKATIERAAAHWGGLLWQQAKVAEKHDHMEAGTPIGPWVPTGRFLHKAIRGVANWHLLVAKDMSDKEALAEAERLASAFGITKGDLYFDPKAFVTWRYPTMPTEPPSDGVGPRPVPNDGF